MINYDAETAQVNALLEALFQEEIELGEDLFAARWSGGVRVCLR